MPTGIRTLPCANCRARHLKCDGESPCSNCKKSDVGCVRASKTFRFKKSSSRPKRTPSFSADQTWLQTTDRPLSFLDETDHVARASANASSSTVKEKRVGFQSAPGSNKDTTDISPSITAHSNASFSHSTSINSDILSETGIQHESPADHDKQHLLDASPSTWSRISRTYSCRMSNPSPLAILGATFPVLNTNIREPADAPSIRLQEACLIRHFVEHLAHSFDTTDRDAHFTLTVPQRAIYNPVLLYAICTASARHLTRLWYRQHPNSVVVFNGILLPDLNEESAIHYHNVCIKLLIEFSKEHSKGSSEDALAAATILRFYEQVDTSLTGLDSETYQNVVQNVIYSGQTPALFSIQSIERPPRDVDSFANPSHGLLCGLALSNKRFQAGMVTAAVGVSLGGEFFEEEGERNAIMRFMRTLEEEHAWPTKAVVNALQDAWSAQGGEEVGIGLGGPASV